MFEERLKNFIDHKDRVRFMDAYLSKNQDWQWFFDYCIENFDVNDVDDFQSFCSRNGYYREVYDKMCRIAEICNGTWCIESDLFKDLNNIALFSIGKIEKNACIAGLRTKFGKLFFLVIWITKLENSDNDTNYVWDFSLLTMNNYWQAITMDSFYLEEKDLIAYIDSLSIKGFDDSEKILKNNIRNVYCEQNPEFFETYSKNMLNVNAFSFNLPTKNKGITWQENTLIDMLAVSFSNGRVNSLFSNGSNSFPNYEKWNANVLKNTKEYFSNPISDFVIETIDYMVNGVVPSKEVVCKHCSMLCDYISSETDALDIITSSSYYVVAKLFSDKSMTSFSREGDVISLIKAVHNADSIAVLGRFIKDRFPVNSEQKSIYKKNVVEQYKSIEKVNNIYELNAYFENEDISKYITEVFFKIAIVKFFKLTENSTDIVISKCFYDCMIFLINANNYNESIDKSLIRSAAISIQEYWEKELYQKMCDNLAVHRYGTSIPSEEIDKFNQGVIISPISLAKLCISSTDDELIDIMSLMSEHALNYMVSRMHIDTIYPIKDRGVTFDKHEIDSLLRNQVESIVEKYGYKFLNHLGTEVYVNGIHERQKQNAIFEISMFHEWENIYKLINDDLHCLLPYSDEVQLGHITQLFPLLERQIRKLGKYFNVVPFKFKESEFMKYKDPSSVLREILMEVHKMMDGFDSVPDLLFVYNFMYNGNSFNVRNECIHGRDYNSGDRLKFGFRISLLSLYMVNKRIELIEANTGSE